MDKVRVGIVGLGAVADLHVFSLLQLGHRAEIVACYTPSVARRESFSAAYPDLRVVDSIEALLFDTSIDAIFILTPAVNHLALVERCASSRKHVLIEKPLEVDLARASQAVEIMERANLTLGVVFQHRFRKASERLASMIASGDLGRLVSGSAQIRWWRGPQYFAEPGRGLRDRDGGGVLLTQAIHTLDLLQSLAGPISQVSAMARTSGLRKIDTEDVVGAAVAFENGAIGTIDATTVAYPGFPERIELAYERGTAVLTGASLDVYLKDGVHIHEDAPENRSGEGDPMALDHDDHCKVISDFLDALAFDRSPRVSGREALKVQSLIEALMDSADRGRLSDVQRVVSI